MAQLNEKLSQAREKEKQAAAMEVFTVSSLTAEKGCEKSTQHRGE